MFDTVLGAEPLLPVEASAPTAPAPFAPVEAHQFVKEEVPEVMPNVQAAPAAQVQEPEFESTAAVASATEDAAVEMTVVENDNNFSGMASPVGATAPAIEERPALRIESNPIVEIKDPLEKIEGIGQVYQTKLYEAGIRTFAQLAAASPSRITEVVEPQNWQTIDIMKWRREAALYAAGEKV
jgi:predicted flap endonuclease-1-like 5' DNA nuclease